MSIISAIEQISREICPMVLPLHPCAKKMLAGAAWAQVMSVLPPVSYLEMPALESRARFILMDWVGVQKEAYFFRRPCITVRDETEWTETLDNQWNVLAGAARSRIVATATDVSAAGPWVAKYGEGNAGSLIARALCQSCLAKKGK